MRFEEFKGGIKMPVSNAELQIIDDIKNSGGRGITMDHLDESDVELARKMVSRGLLNRIKVDELTRYVINDDNWSDE
jgi:hypothetical protein